MSDNNSNFKIMLQAMLDKAKSIFNIKSDIKNIESKLPKVKVQATLDSAKTRSELNAKLKSIRPKVKVDVDTTQAVKKIKKLGRQKIKPTVQPTVDNAQVVSGLKEAQKQTKTLWDRFISGAVGVNLVRMSVQKVTQAIYQAIAGIKELDKIKTDIQTASGVDDSKVNSMMKSYNQIAKDLSSTTKDVGNAANEIVRMGESLSDTNKLIENSTMLAKIGMIESSQATEYLISSMKGFQISAQDSTQIIDKLTSVDMQAAVSAGGLAEAMSRCSNIANNSGTSMDRLIGYMATVGEVTQDSMSVIGNAFKSMYSRMNNIKIGKFIDDETGESLSDTEAVLNKLGIQLRDTQNTYRDFDDVLDDVGNNWRNFTQVEQNAISVAIAGTMQRERFIALMNNYSNALKYSEVAANSAGSALERYGVYQDSIEAKTNELTAAIESLSMNVVSEELYSGIIQATTGLVEFLDKTNLLKGALSGLVAMGVSKAFVSISTGIISAVKSTTQLSAAMVLFDKGTSVNNLKKIGQACIGINNNQLKLVLSTKGLTNAQRLQILTGMGLEEAERQQTLATLGFANAENAATASTFSLKAAVTGLGASIKAAFLSNPVGIAIMAVSTAIGFATSAISKHNQAVEEARQKAIELTNSYKEQRDSLDSQIEKYRELKETLDNGNLSTDEARSIKEQLLEIQKSLIDSYGNEASNIDLVNGKYKEQLGILSELSKEKATDYVAENRDVFEDAKKELEKIRTYTINGIVNWNTLSPKTEDQQALLDFIESYSELFDITADGSSNYASGQFDVRNLVIKADVESADEIMRQFYDDLDQFGKNNNIDVSGILEGISGQLKKTTADEFKEYGSIYEEFMKAEIVRNDTLRPLYQQSIQAVEDYNEALSSGEGVAEAKANLDTVQQSVQNATGELEGSQKVFDDIYNGINKNAESAYNLAQSFENNESVKEFAEQLRGLTDIDLQAINFEDNVQSPGEEAFGALIDILGVSEEEVQSLIDKLVELGYVQGKVQNLDLDLDSPTSTFEDAWADSFTSENDKVKELGDTLLDLAEKGRLTKEAFKEADSTAGDYFKNLGISADEAVSKINKLVDESKQLSSMSDQISSMAEALGTKLEDGFVSADTLSGFDVEVRGLESWDRFQSVLGSTTSSYGECQEAANALATEWINSSDFLAQLTEQNEEYYRTQLKAMGIENYDEVISYAHSLNEAKEVLSQSSLELGNATYDGIEALIAEGQYSELTADMILALYDAKIAEQAVTLDTAADCENLIALAGDTDRTSRSIQLLIQLMNIYNQLESGAYENNAVVRGGALAAAVAIKSQLETIANGEVKNMEIEPTVKLGNKGKSGASKAGRKTADAYLEAFEKELEKLQGMRDRNEITEKEYLDNLRALYEKYFKDREKYIDEFKKYEHEYLEGMESEYRDVMNGIIKLMDKQSDKYDEMKDSAVDSYNAQKDAAEDAYDAQIENIDAQIEAINDQIDAIDAEIEAKKKQADAIQDEIDKIKEAREERQKQLDLQKDLYELERMQHQRTILQYSEQKGMHYVADTSGIRDAKEKVDQDREDLHIMELEKQIDLINDEIDLLEERKGAFEDQIDGLEKQKDAIEKMKDASNDYFESMIKQTETYYDKLIESLDKTKSRWEELADLKEEAEMKSRMEEILAQYGVTADDVVNMSEETFQAFKNDYLAILSDLYSGNEQMQSAIADTAGTTTDQLESYIAKTQEYIDSLISMDMSDTAASMDNTAESMDKLSTATSDANENTKAMSENMGTLSTNTAELGENATTVSDALSSIPDAEKFNVLTTAFTNLAEAIKSVADALGVSGNGTVNSLVDTLQSLSTISIDADGNGLITQFNNLKTAIEGVTNAISGGMSGGSAGEGSPSSSPSMSAGAGGKGSAVGGLIGAVEGIRTATDEALGTGGGEDGEGGGTGAIGQFEQLKDAVDDVTASIGGGGSSESGQGSGGSEGDNADSLIGSIVELGDTTEEILTGGGESEGGSSGVIGRFEEFSDVIEEAKDHVTGISEGLDEIDGKEVECTIRVNIETNGSLPSIVGSGMNLGSAQYDAKYVGNAHVEGTALASGNWAVQSDEKEALLGEVGYEIIVRNGRFFTVGENGAEMFPIKKGDIVFNHEQSEELLKNGHISGRGKAYADGTVGGGKYLMPDGRISRPLQPGDRMYDMLQKFDAYFNGIDRNVEKLVPNSYYDHQKQMEQMANQVTNYNNVVNNTKNVQPSVNVGDIHITCPGVTSYEVMREVKTQINNEVRGLRNYADQQSRIR